MESVTIKNFRIDGDERKKWEFVTKNTQTKISKTQQPSKPHHQQPQKKKIPERSSSSSNANRQDDSKLQEENYSLKRMLAQKNDRIKELEKNFADSRNVCEHCFIKFFRFSF